MSGIRVELQLEDGSFTTSMVRAGQSVSSFRKELARVNPHFNKLERSGRGLITSIRKTDVVSKNLLSTLRDVSIVSGALVMGFRAIVGSGNGVIGSITRINAEMERLKYQMLGMSVSAEPMKEAGAAVDYLRQKATEAPFSLNQLASSFVKLKATGTDPMAGSLQAVVDGIAAFGGTDEQLHRVTLGIVQMSGKSVIQMEEMRQQLGESMPNAMRIMARSMGVSVADLTKAISTGRVEASSALRAFYAELDRTYGGKAQMMMETFSGQVTQLKANLQILATGDGMKGFFEEQKAGLLEINEFLKSDEAKKFAKQLGDAMTAAVRGIRLGVKAVYEFRREIAQIIQLMAGAAAFKMFGSLAVKMAASLNLAKMAMAGLGASVAQGASMMRLGASGLVTMQAAGTSAGLVFVGLRTAVVGFGSALMVAAPWLVAIGAVLALGANKMGLFGDKTDDAYESLKRYGAESKEQAKSIIADQEAILRSELDTAGSQVSKNTDRGQISVNDNKRYASAQKAWQDFQMEKSRILRSAEEEDQGESVRRYANELKLKLRENNDNFNKLQVNLDRQHDLELNDIKEGGRTKFQIDEEYQKLTLKNRQNQNSEILRLLDEEIKKHQEMLNAADDGSEAAGKLSRLIDFLNGRRVAAAELANSLGDFGISLTPDIESDETKIKRGAKLVKKLAATVKGMQAELIGAGNAYAKLQFEIARGDYGSVEDGSDAVREMHQALLDATAQKEALDVLMKGDKKAARDLESMRIADLEREMELRAELADDVVTNADKYQFKLDNGYYAGLGPIENIRKAVQDVVDAFTTQSTVAAEVGKVIREEAFGPQSIDRINAANRALGGVLNTTLGIKGALLGTNFGGLSAGGGGSYARNGGMLDLIASVEIGKDGYNTTLDNGRWTGGAQNLVSKTLNEILTLQKGMLDHPENRALYGSGDKRGSSALGRYQIVSITLKGLMKEMGLTGGELFNEKMQDNMAMRLMARRGNDVDGLRNEWAGLKGVPPEVIRAAMGRETMGPTRARSAGLNPDAGTLPTNDLDAMIAERVRKTAELTAGNDALRPGQATIQDLEEQVKRKNYLKSLVAKTNGAGFEVEGLGKNFSAAIKAIGMGKLGTNTNIEADEYKAILKAATELDQVNRRIAETRKATRQSDAQFLELERERAELAERITEQQELARNPDYEGQSNDLRRLIEDLDKYVNRVALAFGEGSKQHSDAQTYSQGLLGEQRTLDAATRQAGLAAETRSVRDGLLSQNQLRALEFRRDMARIDAIAQARRDAGMAEVDIVRDTEAAKAAIRDQYFQATNPVAAQMEEWRDIQGNLTNATTGWTGSLGDGVAGLVTGTTDLRSAASNVIDGMLSDVINAQTKFLMSSMGGDKASTAAGKMGSAGKGKFSAGTAHTGGIAGGSLRSTRMSPMSFVGAPKFHTGGIAGMPRLKKDEIPILAKKKEGIFTEGQMAAMAPVGSGASPITIHAPVSVTGSSGSAEQNDDLAKRMSRELEGTMRGVVVDEIRRQQRPGNMLNNGRAR